MKGSWESFYLIEIAYQLCELGEAKEIELPGYYLKSLEQANQVLSVLSA